MTTASLAVLLAVSAGAQGLPAFEEQAAGVLEAVASATAVKAEPPRDELTLHIYPSYYGLDWDTPGALTRATVLNTLPDLITKNGISIGHVTIELSCRASVSRPARRILTAMTQADLDEGPRMLLKEGLGLGLLFHDFKGALETAERIEGRLAKRARRGKISFVAFQVGPDACRRMERYFDEYKAKGYDKHYGLPNRPLHGEGAGCSAFAAGFMEAGGILSAEHRSAWMKTLDVPLKYIGDPAAGRKVRFAGLFFPLKRTHWAREGEPYKTVDFYDPDSMSDWVQAKVAARDSASAYQVRRMGRSFGVVFDVSAAPVPDGPIWK